METNQSEAALQQSCRIWFWNNYPQLRGLLFMVNNNSSNKLTGKIAKELGVIAGVSDLLFIFGGTVHCIEMKTLTGYQSPEQKIWQKKVEEQGVRYYIAKTKLEFEHLIKKIIYEYTKSL